MSNPEYYYTLTALVETKIYVRANSKQKAVKKARIDVPNIYKFLKIEEIGLVLQEQLDRDEYWEKQLDEISRSDR